MNHTLLFLFCFIFLATPSSFAQQQNNDRVKYSDWEKQQRDYFFRPGQKPASGYKQFERVNLDWENHLDKDGYMFNYSAENMQQYMQLKDVTVPSGSNWDFVGPHGPDVDNDFTTGGTGRINCIQVFDADTWFVGASGGGLWKTDNAGLYIAGVFDNPWQNLTDNMPSLSISGIAVNPQNENEIFILTGDPFTYSRPSIGIYKTSDGGENWEPTDVEFTRNQLVFGYKLLANPDDFLEQYACTSIGLYHTTDGWQTSNLQIGTTEEPEKVFDVEFHPSNSEIVYASSYNRIYKMDEGEASFTYADDEITELGPSRIELAVTPAEPDWIYAAYIDDDDTFGGIYFSTDKADTWQQMANGTYNLSASTDPEDPEDNTQGVYCMALYADVESPQSLYYACVNLWHSTASGLSNSWGQLTNWVSDDDVHADFHAIVYNPYTGNLIAGSDGGVYESSDGGDNWENRNFGLHITEFYHVAVDNNWLVTINAAGGAQDNGTISSVVLDGIWDDQRIQGGDGFEVVLNTLSDFGPEYYTENQYGNLFFQGLRNGFFFDGTIYPDDDAIETGIQQRTNRFDTPYEVSPNEWSELIIGYEDLFYSNNIGEDWAKIWDVSEMTGAGNSAEIMDVDFPGGNLAGFTVKLNTSDDSHVNRVYATTQIAQMIIMSDFTLWNEFTMDDLGLPDNSSISDISLLYYDDNGPNVYGMALSLSGYDSANKVLFLPDFTAHPDSILNLTFDLPNIPVLCIEQHETGIYIGTDIGVFFLGDGSNSWQYHNSGLPVVPVTEIEFKETLIEGELIYISTYGRGMWRNNLATQQPIRRYVDVDATGGNDGTTWENAFTSLSTALSVANPLDSLWIAEGTYVPGTLRTYSFMIDGEKLFGGFAGTETSLSERNPALHISRLSGNIGSAGVATDNSYRLLVPNYYDHHCELDGITFSDGYANGSTADQKIGGCFKVSTVTPTGVSNNPLKRPHFTNCIFENFYATTSGGVFHFEDYSTSVYDFGGEVLEIPVIFDTCIFRNNYAQYGGAIFNDNANFFTGAVENSLGDANFKLNNCIFENNSAQSGGAIYFDSQQADVEFDFTNTVFTGNQATFGAAGTGRGGAIFSTAANDGNFIKHFSNCTFTANTATSYGGAVYNYCGKNSNNNIPRGYIESTYDNCTFTSNTGSLGGAVSDDMGSYGLDVGNSVAVFTTCTFESNYATSYGGAFFSDNTGNTSTGQYTFDNCILNNNDSGSQGGAIKLDGSSLGHGELILNNSIFTNSDAGTNGGAIYGEGFTSGYFSIIADSCLFDNCAADYGGAVHLSSAAGSTVAGAFTNTSFNANHANGAVNGSRGGAVHHGGAGNHTCAYNNCTFTGNHSNQSAGAVSIEQQDISFTGCNFIGNYCALNGGVSNISHWNSVAEHTTSFDNCFFQDNLATGTGGVVTQGSNNSVPFHLPVTNCEFVNNQGSNGGCFYLSGGVADVDFTYSTFTSNQTGTAGGDGGALSFHTSGNLSLIGCTFDGNTAGEFGGSLDINSASLDLTVGITNCNFNSGDADNGGAIYMANNNSTNITADIYGCDFSNNEADLGAGAAMFQLYDYCLVDVTYCSFSGNHSLNSTGAMHFASVSTTDTSLVQVNESLFENNSAVGAAGALHFLGDGSLRSIVNDCIFRNNSCAIHGGAIRVYTYTNDYTDVDISNCLFDDNTATSRGGAIEYEASAATSETYGTVDQCVFTGNTAAEGGAMQCYITNATAQCNVDVRNSVMFGNHATTKCGGLSGYRTNGTLTLQSNNSIVWNNTDVDTEVNEKQLYKSGTATFTARNSDVKDGLNAGIIDGGGNIISDPLFLNTADTDGADNIFGTTEDGFALQETSPCIDTALELYSATTDIANTPRPQLNGYDIGAYESLATEPELCFGDLNDDGVVNTTDLLLFMSAFGCNSACGIADLNGDGVVNTTDLLLFMSAFGNVCE